MRAAALSRRNRGNSKKFCSRFWRWNGQMRGCWRGWRTRSETLPRDGRRKSNLKALNSLQTQRNCTERSYLKATILLKNKRLRINFSNSRISQGPFTNSFPERRGIKSLTWICKAQLSANTTLASRSHRHHKWSIRSRNQCQDPTRSRPNLCLVRRPRSARHVCWKTSASKWSRHGTTCSARPTNRILDEPTPSACDLKSGLRAEI